LNNNPGDEKERISEKKHQGDDHGGHGSDPNMKNVALSIRVMGISLVVIIVLYLSFGYIGPSFSANRMLQQQKELSKQYGLPPPTVVPRNLLEVPNLREPM
jgi:hypothetical protein